MCTVLYNNLHHLYADEDVMLLSRDEVRTNRRTMQTKFILLLKTAHMSKLTKQDFSFRLWGRESWPMYKVTPPRPRRCLEKQLDGSVRHLDAHWNCRAWMEDLQLGIVGGPRSAVRAVESVLVRVREKCSSSRLPANAPSPFSKVSQQFN